MGNIWNQSLDFIVKFIPNPRECRTLKKKVNFVFHYIASTKRAVPIILRSLILSAYFYQISLQISSGTQFCIWKCGWLGPVDRVEPPFGWRLTVVERGWVWCDISIILHIIRKPNSIIVSLFIQNISKLLTRLPPRILFSNFCLFLFSRFLYILNRCLFLADIPQKLDNINRAICFAHSCILVRFQLFRLWPKQPRFHGKIP